MKRQPLHRTDDAARCQELDMEVLDLEQGRARDNAGSVPRFHPLFDDAHRLFFIIPMSAYS